MKKQLFFITGAAAVAMLARELFDIGMCRSRNKLSLAPLVHLDKEQKALNIALDKEKSEIESWKKRVYHESWHIRRSSGTILYAKAYMLSGRHKWAVVIHGYGGDGSLMLYAAKRFYERGYNVLLPDLRAHGKSTGKYIGWGWLDKGDILDWCSCIKKRDKNAETVLYGVSMGGAAVLMAAGEKKPDGVRCVVSDCAYTSLRDILYYRIRRMFHLPPAVVMLWLKPLCQREAGLSVDDASVIEQVKKCSLPLMFCHGDRDRFVPTDSALELYAAAKAPKKLMLVHGAGHGISAFTGGENYWKRVFDFTEKFER